MCRVSPNISYIDTIYEVILKPCLHWLLPVALIYLMIFLKYPIDILCTYINKTDIFDCSQAVTVYR